jgi:hypothetical protein
LCIEVSEGNGAHGFSTSSSDLIPRSSAHTGPIRYWRYRLTLRAWLVVEV